MGGRSLDKVQDAIAAAKKEFPSSASTLVPIQVDVEHDDSIERAFTEVQTKFGRVDALINNAGKYTGTPGKVTTVVTFYISR